MAKKRPKSQELADAILADFVDGRGLKAGDRLPPIRQLQRFYNSSSTAIAHALSLLEGRGVIEKTVGSGCYITDMASAVSSRAQDAVGLVLQLSRTTELQFQVLKGVERQCARAGYSVLVAVSSQDRVREREHVYRLAAAGCKALIVYPVHRCVEDIPTDFLITETMPVPVVLVDLPAEEHPQSKILFDNYRAGYDMTRFLFGRGHKRIAFMRYCSDNGRLIHRANSDRFDGFRQAISEAGVELREEDIWPIIHRSDQHLPCVQAALRRWKEQPNRPTAVVCTGDPLATVVHREARSLGVAVPEELELAGFGSLPMADAVVPRFASASSDFELMGELAAQVALRHSDGSLKEPVRYILPVTIDPHDAVPGGGWLTKRVRDSAYARSS
jgi:DNA-binding LacI/PurR family transcriptional regulator